MTIRAGFADDLSHPLAVRTGPRQGEEPLLLPKLPPSPTGWAVHGLAAFAGAPSAARAAHLPARNLDLGFEARRGLLQGNLHVVAQIGAALGPRTPAAPPPEYVADAKQIAQDVFEIRKDRGGEIGRIATRVVYARVPEAVVRGALLRVGQHAVGFRDLLEPLFGFIRVLGIPVRMVLEGQFPVGALDLLLRRTATDAQNLVVISLVVQSKTPLCPLIPSTGISRIGSNRRRR